MSEVMSDAQRYLDDLDRLLRTADPADRAEVMLSVREHIDVAVAELGHEPSDAEMRRILADLGTPAQVAEGALGAAGDRPSPAPVPPATSPPASPTRPALAGAWVPPVAFFALLIGSLFLWGVVPVLALIAGIVLVCASPLWTTAQKVLAAAVAPLLIALPVILSAVMYLQLTRVESSSDQGITESSGGGSPIIALLLVGLVIAGICLLVATWIAGARASARLHADAEPVDTAPR